MNSLIFSTATRLLMPLLLVFSLFLLIRGHHAPGGGFVGGLVAAGAFVLQALATDVDTARRLLRIDSRTIAVAGLSVALISGIVGPLVGRPFMTGLWLGGAESLAGTPVVFDVGVYLAVFGVTLTVLFSLAEGQRWK